MIAYTPKFDIESPLQSNPHRFCTKTACSSVLDLGTQARQRVRIVLQRVRPYLLVSQAHVRIDSHVSTLRDGQRSQAGPFDVPNLRPREGG
jgi:hypothetical protein